MIKKIILTLSKSKGQSITEYGLIIILASIGMMTTIALFGSRLSSFMAAITTIISELI